MVTDPARIRKDDPGNPYICSVFDLHETFGTGDGHKAVAASCLEGSIGCGDCKKRAAASLDTYFEEYRSQREGLDLSDDVISDILRDGSLKARVVAQKTLGEVKEKLHLVY